MKQNLYFVNNVYKNFETRKIRILLIIYLVKGTDMLQMVSMDIRRLISIK